jgi:uncharacterized protein with GYD domain
MARFVLLLKFTDQGIAAAKDSPTRAGEFAALAARAGARVEAQYWLLGEYDALAVVTAPSEETATALALQLSARGFVRTRVCRAYDEAEFKAVLGKV